MLVEWKPQAAPVEPDALVVPVAPRAELEDDWSYVDCCSAMRPRPAPRPLSVDQEPDVAWTVADNASPLEHVA